MHQRHIEKTGALLPTKLQGLSDQALISQIKANYIQPGYDPKKAEQCAMDDFTSATVRFPNPSF